MPREDRDRFVLSKGHSAPGLYSVLAERGYFPKEDLLTLRHTGSYLQGHPDMKHIPGVTIFLRTSLAFFFSSKISIFRPFLISQIPPHNPP
mgnify:CR=1 FL=1